MDTAQQSRNAAAYATRLDLTLRTLQDRVKEQEDVLAELRASSGSIPTQPAENPRSYLQQLRFLKAAYETSTPAEPWLPASDSPLPALLALRNTNTCIEESRESIARTERNLKNTTQRLEKEQLDLSEANVIQKALKDRTSSLEAKIQENTQKSPSQNAKDMLREIKKQQSFYELETVKLVKAFNAFIDDHLAIMLAAEELGGPIVGDDLEINEDMLEAGFSAYGKARKSNATSNTDKRQRRIDEIWGSRSSEQDRANDTWSEKQAAAAEMRELTEHLLNNLAEAEGNGPGTYVDLERESAAARFLVRSKAAQFHPKDARKLRLLDFGGELGE